MLQSLASFVSPQNLASLATTANNALDSVQQYLPQNINQYIDEVQNGGKKSWNVVDKIQQYLPLSQNVNKYIDNFQRDSKNWSPIDKIQQYLPDKYNAYIDSKQQKLNHLVNGVSNNISTNYLDPAYKGLSQTYQYIKSIGSDKVTEQNVGLLDKLKNLVSSPKEALQLSKQQQGLIQKLQRNINQIKGYYGGGFVTPKYQSIKQFGNQGISGFIQDKMIQAVVPQNIRKALKFVSENWGLVITLTGLSMTGLLPVGIQTAFSVLMKSLPLVKFLGKGLWKGVKKIGGLFSRKKQNKPINLRQQMILTAKKNQQNHDKYKQMAYRQLNPNQQVLITSSSNGQKQFHQKNKNQNKPSLINYSSTQRGPVIYEKNSNDRQQYQNYIKNKNKKNQLVQQQQNKVITFTPKTSLISKNKNRFGRNRINRDLGRKPIVMNATQRPLWKQSTNKPTDPFKTMRNQRYNSLAA